MFLSFGVSHFMAMQRFLHGRYQRAPTCIVRVLKVPTRQQTSCIDAASDETGLVSRPVEPRPDELCDDEPCRDRVR